MAWGMSNWNENRERRLEGSLKLLLGPRWEEMDGVRVCPGCLMATSWERYWVVWGGQTTEGFQVGSY